MCYIEYAAEGPLPCPPMARLLISLFLLICLCGCGGCGAYGYRRRYYVQRVQYAQPVTTTVITPAPGKSWMLQQNAFLCVNIVVYSISNSVLQQYSPFCRLQTIQWAKAYCKPVPAVWTPQRSSTPLQSIQCPASLWCYVVSKTYPGFCVCG